MKPRRIVAIGASAGGIEALQTILQRLPADLPAAVLIALHTPSAGGRFLSEILQRGCSLTVRFPNDHEELQAGHVYLAPPDFHMTVEDGHLRVLQGPRENRNRPAIDPLFRTAARHFGSKLVAIILTGLLDDGALGLMLVHSCGGHTIIQDPQCALFPGMPKSALEQVPDARVLPLEQIAPAISQFAAEEPAHRTAAPESSMSERSEEGRRGTPSPFGCPECGGVLWENEDEGFLHFRCRVGHAYSAQNLDVEQRRAIEAALWSALRALEESASFYRRMAERASGASRSASAEKFDERAATSEKNAQVLRDFLINVNRNGEV